MKPEEKAFESVTSKNFFKELDVLPLLMILEEAYCDVKVWVSRPEADELDTDGINSDY